MAGKGEDPGAKAASALAGAVAAYLARKAISAAWTRITGRKPPEKDAGRHVALGEAVAWAVILGAGVGAARVVAVRAATRRPRRDLGGMEG